MMRVRFSALSLGLLLASQAQAGGGLVPKQLAGPASEFAAMQPLDPADAAIHSKAALLSVELGADKAGGLSWQGELPVQGNRVRMMLFAPNGADWQVQLRDPSGRMDKSANAVAAQPKRADFGIEEARFPARYYAFDKLASGTWSIRLSAAGTARQRGFLLIEGDPATQLVSYQTHKRQLTGERIGVTALLARSAEGETIGLGADAGEIHRAELKVTAPNGSEQRYAMHDDGLHDDGAAGDGVYGAAFAAKAAGKYQAQVIVSGRDAQGQPLLRTAEHLIPVVEPSLSLAQAKAAGSETAGGRVRIDIPVHSNKQGGSAHYRAYAEVWGRDAGGAERPVAWIGGMVTPANGKLSLGLDPRWVAHAKAQGPFELRNLRLEDADHFITVAAAKRLPLSLPVGVERVKAGNAIDEAMLMGPRPAELAQSKGVGSRLLLVHGYCSAGVWPEAHFTNASSFADHNQSRTHDQFARLIQSFGSPWHSYGVVGHSQGGAASLHLYTYYWSGLDNAGAGRLIQSVGTPYQGTNLAGILAALGSWFGVGCGTNDNLTYSGASAWLAGIPTWARAKVNYYTTSFRITNWWTNDYCNFATDLVLNDPEDGTTEQSYGQLSGAVNRGHTTGQCHTRNMRDPAQFLDATRNAVMNTNAAR